MSQNRVRKVIACFVAMAAVIMALAGGYLIRPMISDETFFWVFYPSMVILALLGGLFPGLLAAQRADSTLAESDRKFMRDRQKAEAALRESEARFRTLSESMPQLVWTATADGQNDYANSRWEQYTGLTRDELAGDGWAQVVHADDRAQAVTTWQTAVRSRVQYDVEFRLRAADGGYRWFKVRGERVLNTDGKVVKWIGTCTDIDHQKRVQEELARAKAAAEEVSRAKDEFLAVLSHELRTPLSPVLLSASALEHQRDLPDDVRTELAMIRRNVELECRLIDDLLDLTRIARNKLPLNMQSVNVHQLIQDTLRICHDDIVAHKLEVRLVLNADVHRVHGDPTRLQQVLWNLVKNACKFTPVGGRITIRTYTTGLPGDNEAGDEAKPGAPGERAEKSQIYLEVSDTGVGISAEALPRIFDAFEQGSRGTTRRFGGLGLGLAISRKLAEMHGGMLKAQSSGTNQGSTFTLSLPVQLGRSSPTYHEFPDLAARESQEPIETGVSLRVLLVEDHADTARVMAKLLESLNCRVSVAHTVADALTLAGNEPFDLVVSDLGLPDASGHDLMRQLRSEHRNLRGIALSGYGMEDDIKRSMEAGFTDHLIKPIQFDQLRTVLTRATAGEETHSG